VIAAKHEFRRKENAAFKGEFRAATVSLTAFVSTTQRLRGTASVTCNAWSISEKLRLSTRKQAGSSDSVGTVVAFANPPEDKWHRITTRATGYSSAAAVGHTGASSR
jgi:hypothetical protein